MRIYL